MTKAKRKLAEMPLSQQAGILANNPNFRRFAASRLGVKSGIASVSAASEFTRMNCEVVTRAELDTDPMAADRFARLLTEFDAWRGKIAAQR